MSEAGQYLLCRVDELADPGSKGCVLTFKEQLYNVFVVRWRDEVYGYINSCPHTGVPLDWVSDRFLSIDDCHIQCATHGALFRLDNGVCVAGPCAGDRLTAIGLRVESGCVFLLTDSLACGD